MQSAPWQFLLALSLMDKFTLLLGGPLTPTPRLREQIAGSRVIAADGGMVHAATLGLEPELWVGDFDSSSASLQAAYPGTPRQGFPANKDKTDGELALEAALERGASQLIWVGALGGQTDHALAHLLLAVRLARQGTGVLLTTGLEEAYPLIPGELGLDLPVGSKFSVLALSDLSGLSIGGARWPLQAVAVPLGSTWTVSNLATGPVEIRLEAGYGVVIAYPGG